MRWTIVRHPDAGAAVISEPALHDHLNRGWVQVNGQSPSGDWHTDPDALRALLEQLPQEQPEPTTPPTPAPAKPAAKTTRKEG